MEFHGAVVTLCESFHLVQSGPSSLKRALVMFITVPAQFSQLPSFRTSPGREKGGRKWRNFNKKMMFGHA